MTDIEKAIRKHVSPMFCLEDEVDEYLINTTFIIKFEDVNAYTIINGKPERKKNFVMSITERTINT